MKFKDILSIGVVAGITAVALNQGVERFKSITELELKALKVASSAFGGDSVEVRKTHALFNGSCAFGEVEFDVRRATYRYYPPSNAYICCDPRTSRCYLERTF